MLIFKPNCECCDKDLPADSTEAMICSFECTFCSKCMSEFFNHRCSNCDGDMAVRPTRAAAYLQTNPVSDVRVRSHYDINIADGVKTITRTRLQDN